MAQSTGQIVASVEYRLAPEYRFPVGLMDCYAAAKTFYTNRFLLNTDPDRITIMGDSAVSYTHLVIPEAEPVSRENINDIAGYLENGIADFLEKYGEEEPEKLLEHRYERFRKM